MRRLPARLAPAVSSCSGYLRHCGMNSAPSTHLSALPANTQQRDASSEYSHDLPRQTRASIPIPACRRAGH